MPRAFKTESAARIPAAGTGVQAPCEAAATKQQPKGCWGTVLLSEIRDYSLSPRQVTKQGNLMRH